MNREMTGTFIAEMRKQHNLTQRDLAEKIGVSDKTVSKWETGKSMPDISYFNGLCEALGITVNELLAGERISVDDYSTKAEETMMALMKETQQNKKHDWIQRGIGIAILVATFILMMSLTQIGMDGILTYPTYLFDLPSILLDVLFAVGLVFAANAKGKEMRLRVLSGTLIPVGVCISLISGIMVLYNLPDLSKIGPNLAVCILSLLYAVVAKIITDIWLIKLNSHEVVK